MALRRPEIEQNIENMDQHKHHLQLPILPLEVSTEPCCAGLEVTLVHPWLAPSFACAQRPPPAHAALLAVWVRLFCSSESHSASYTHWYFCRRETTTSWLNCTASSMGALPHLVESETQNVEKPRRVFEAQISSVEHLPVLHVGVHFAHVGQEDHDFHVTWDTTQVIIHV